MGINSTEVSYNFGQLGSAFNDGTGVMTPPTGKVFIAITMLDDCKFNATDGLEAANDSTAGLEYIGTDEAAHNSALSPDLGESGVGGLQVDASNTFPAGVTIYGRWNKIKPTEGSIIAYIGQ